MFDFEGIIGRIVVLKYKLIFVKTINRTASFETPMGGNIVNPLTIRHFHIFVPFVFFLEASSVHRFGT